MKRLAGIARRLGRIATGPRVSIVAEAYPGGHRHSAALDALARRPRSMGPVLEALVVGPPDVELPARVGDVPVGRAPTLDDAVQAARGDYLVLLGPDEAVLPDGWAAMAGALEESGSDLVVGDMRGLGARSWAGELFGHRRLRQDTGSCPLALVDLSLSNKMFRLDTWRRADVRLGPGPLVEAGPAAVLAAYDAADTFDVLARAVAESTVSDATLPVAQQARFRPSVLDVRLRGLRRALETAPPGWVDLVATHLLPPLYVDAVGGGEPYFAALAEGSAAIVEAMDPARVPVAARLGAWLARHGTLQDQALLQDLLADCPHGLPVSGGSVPVPAGLSVDVPLEWQAIRVVDRRPRTQVSGRVVLVGARCRLEGASFTEYLDETPLPDVSLLGPGGPITLQVERRQDPRINEWAARAFEDRSDAGWTAWFDSSLLAGLGGEHWTVEVHASGHSSQHQVAGLRGDQPRAGTVVESVALAGGSLTLAGRLADDTDDTDEPELRAFLTGPHGRTARAALKVEGGRFTGAVELSSLRFGERVRLPVGRYELRLVGAGRAPVPWHWSTGLLDDPPELVDDRQRVTLSDDGHGDGDVPAVRVRPPLRALERGAFAQQDLRSRVYQAPGSMPRSARRRASYEQTVLLETFRGRSVGDNPGAIGRELLRRDLGLDLAWVVDDPGVAVPLGTRPVVRRSQGWYDLLAGAHAYVANAGAPYWFEKRPGQIHLQTWHGTPLKHIGEDRGPGDFATWRHRRAMASQAARWDAMLSPGPMFSEIFRSAFDYRGPFWEVGYPRNDVLLAPEAGQIRDDVRRRLGLEPGDRVVLYAPTWRSYLGERESKPLFLDAEQAIRTLPDTVVLVRGHYTATSESEAFAGHDRVHDVTRYPEIAELFVAADVLVTDYSSVMFDFVLTDKPVILLTPDLEQYREVERGFYFDLEEHAPGPLTRSTAGVVEALSRPDTDGPRRAGFRARFCPLEDGRSAAQTVDRLLELW